LGEERTVRERRCAANFCIADIVKNYLHAFNGSVPSNFADVSGKPGKALRPNRYFEGLSGRNAVPLGGNPRAAGCICVEIATLVDCADALVVEDRPGGGVKDDPATRAHFVSGQDEPVVIAYDNIERVFARQLHAYDRKRPIIPAASSTAASARGYGED
jgi:hypothetical protein